MLIQKEIYLNGSRFNLTYSDSEVISLVPRTQTTLTLTFIGDKYCSHFLFSFSIVVNVKKNI